ncbi:MAG: hypothetical protein LAP39_05220 [Acidobacteriia bacterium]|nr:hypothetical protein [Terriglobia bacterium]
MKRLLSLASAVRSLIDSHRITEAELDRLEALHFEDLKRQKERSEREFREGNVVTWEEVKRRNGLE